MASSMYRDLVAGQKVEADQILGDLVTRGVRHGLETPLLAASYSHMCVQCRSNGASLSETDRVLLQMASEVADSMRSATQHLAYERRSHSGGYGKDQPVSPIARVKGGPGCGGSSRNG